MAEQKSKPRVTAILEKIEDKFTTDSEKATLGDYVRLRALRAELDEDEQPREVVVRWEELAVTSLAE